MRRKLEDQRCDVDEMAKSIPADIRDKIEEDHNKIADKLNKLSDNLKARGGALDGVLPFITHLQVTFKILNIILAFYFLVTQFSK